MVTSRQKAAYCDITLLGAISNRSAFKVARVSNGDWFTKLIPLKNVPNKDILNLDRYSRGYTVTIGDDILWVDNKAIEEAREYRKKVLEGYKKAEEEQTDAQ